MIFNGEKERRAVDEQYDYIIIGSGAAGGVAARVLADTGAKIAVVEEGPHVETKEFGDKVWPAFKKMFRNMGGTVAKGRAFIPVIQGIGLGGGTLVNSAITWRMPDDVYEPWKSKFNLGEALPLADLHKHWDILEKELHIHPVLPEAQGEINRLMEVASKKMNVMAHAIKRGDVGCKGSARCLQGCPHDAKQGMHITYLPYAEKKGAVMYTSARVERVEVKGGRAVAVHGFFHVPAYRKNIAPFTLRATKGVIVAASAIQTPGILHRSGVRSPHLGKHFQGHPGSPLMGIWENKVNMWFGATQGYDADHHRQDYRVKIETIALPPEIAFARMPGVGKKWLDGMMQTGYGAVWAVQLRAHAEGSVGFKEGFLGTDIKYDLTEQDMVNLRKGLRFDAEMMFAAGAKEVMLGITGMPERIRSVDEAKMLENGPSNPNAYNWIVSHLMSTARMSVRPEDGVVGTDFAVHGTKNLWVLDSSVFPTNLGVNPQHAIMGIAWHGAEKIAARG